MNRSALQFTLRAWFVAGVSCAMFSLACLASMWTCLQLKNDAVRETLRLHDQALLYEDRAETLLNEATLIRYEIRQLANRSRAMLDALRNTHRESAKFKIGDSVTVISGPFSGTPAVIISALSDSLPGHYGCKSVANENQARFEAEESTLSLRDGVWASPIPVTSDSSATPRKD